MRTNKNINKTDETFEVSPIFLKKLDNAINVWFEPKKKLFKVIFKINEYTTKFLKRIPLNLTQRELETLLDGSLFEIKNNSQNGNKKIYKKFFASN